MATRAAAGLLRTSTLLKTTPLERLAVRTKTTTRSGKVLPQPQSNLTGVIGVPLVVIPGLLTGASISKAFANFLEENDLFVPEDDDDDD